MKDADIKVVGLSSNQTKGKTNWKILGAIIGIIVLAIGVVAGIILVRQNQNVQEKASSTLEYGRCDESGSEACPGSDGILRNCHPPQSDNTPELSECNSAGRVEFCGTRNYCCPSVGGTWTTDMTACTTATATAASSARQDYCVSASINGGVGGNVTVNVGGTVTLSSISNTAVNGFYYVAYNMDNLYSPGNAKPVCTGTGTHDQCPNGGTPLTFYASDTTTLRTTGSTQVSYASLFVTDKNTGQQAKNISINAYISLNGGAGSVAQPACVVYATKAVTGATATATSTSTTSATATSTSYATATATSTSTTVATSTAAATSTSTSRATATATASSVPLPVTGASWPTMLGTGFGIIMILLSLSLAL